MSSLGRVRCETREVPYRSAGKLMTRRGHLMALIPYDKGRHVKVRLRGGRKQRAFGVHQLVLMAFVGPMPAGFQGRHLDGNGLNNAVGNLAWGTCLENQCDRARHGTTNQGARNANAKLTADEVARIRAAGGSHAAVAASFGISKSHVSNIRAGRVWAHPGADHAHS